MDGYCELGIRRLEGSLHLGDFFIVGLNTSYTGHSRLNGQRAIPGVNFQSSAIVSALLKCRCLDLNHLEWRRLNSEINLSEGGYSS